MVSTQFAYRTVKEIGLTEAQPTYAPVSGFEKPTGNLRVGVYSPDGSYFAWASPENVSVVKAEDGAKIATLDVPNVFEIAFSPKGTYVQTWQRPSKAEDGNATKNLQIWDVKSGTLNYEFVQKNQTGWNCQFTFDEKYCARLVTNEVQIFESANMSKGVWNKLRVEGISAFALSPGQNYALASFLPERKGQPARVCVYNVPSFIQPAAQKTFFKADSVKMTWNKLGTSLLVLTQTEVDKTNKNYYGETNLYLLSIAGNFDSRVVLDKEGPIHDVTWSPNSKEFGVVYGYMPAKTTVFNHRANAVISLPLAPRNTIIFSPHARFMILAGFGNLQGTMDIYDTFQNYKKLSTIEASNASVCEWSPDGRMILTATTSPRLRVDNGVKLWHYSGPLIYQEEMTELYAVHWRPQPAELYPLRTALSPAPEVHSSVASAATLAAPQRPAGAYRPPHLRGTSTPTHFKREDEGGARHVMGEDRALNGATNGQRLVPGAHRTVPGAAPAAAAQEQLSKNALKNKKKREAAKKAKEEEQPEEVAVPEPAPAADDAPAAGAEDKKTRALLKKLRAIEELKVRVGKGEKLEDTQIKKIATEDQIRKELAALGWDD
ncbi:translation initiation factor eIF-2A [Saitoella complicata NRRL Y-17804]|nr:translation initiation factor eIF-2A [Saitoella complicata NRRL Y-17804]ODQ56482.1 translation initiation factor eIF-2A [Saitoella complicata NRRL Y-17804]